MARCIGLRKLLLLALQLIIINSQLSISEVRYVSKTGSSLPPYTSWATASDSIQKCINISNFGDTIYVGKGNYKEIIVMKDGLSLIGSGMDSCIIDMTRQMNYVNAVTMKDSCLLQGFSIKFENSLYGRPGQGILIVLQDTTKGCRVLHNKIEGTQTALAATEVIFNFNIINNTRSAIFLGVFDLSREYYAQIDSNYINYWDDGIFEAQETKVKARGNIISPGPSGIIYNDFLSITTYTDFQNNLVLIPKNDPLLARGFVNSFPGIFNNNVFLARFDRLFHTSAATIKNNIAINSNYGIWGDTTNVKYNNFWKMVKYPKDSTNISVDPMFVNDSTDFHLQMYSPLIDAGDPAILDKDGSRSDIGLYGGPFGMSYPYLDIAPRTPVNFLAVVDSNIIKLMWNKNTEADFRKYILYRDTVPNFQITAAKIIAVLEDSLFTDVLHTLTHNYYYKLTAVDKQGNQSEPGKEIAVIFTGVKEYHKVISDYQLYQNYPNPFNSTTKIGYRLANRGYVKIYVYDSKGESIAVVENQEREAGYYEAEFKAWEGLSSGVYLYRIDITDSERKIPVYSYMNKMLMIK